MGDLLSVRTQCVKFSGRYDLVVDATDFADAGMNWFIDAGRKYLDSRVTSENSEGIFTGILAIGDTAFTFAGCRSILDLWFVNSLGAKIFPKRLTFEQFNRDYSQSPSLVTNDEPEAWAPNIIRSASTPVSADNLLKGIIFSPSADEAYTIKAKGLFFSEEFCNPTGI